MTNPESIEAKWKKWIELFDELRRAPDIDSDQIAAPFLSVRAAEPRSILYVGKATSKDGPSSDLPTASGEQSIERRISERCECTETFLRYVAPTYPSGFWQFARALNTEAAKKWKREVKKPLQHIAWTNIFKIGALKDNPKGYLRERQKDLAIETLRFEVKLYKPELIYFVTGDYEYDVVGQVIRDPDHKSWDKSEEREGMWWRQATDGLPSILWTYHPQGKPAEQLRNWLKKASELLPE